MIEQKFAKDFAEEWINGWNAHDLPRILSHYTDDFTMETPKALQFVPESGGVIKGKAAIAAYWSIALERIPDLFFELHEIFIGINGITLYYTNRAIGKQTTEVLFFNEHGKVNRAYAFYN